MKKLVLLFFLFFLACARRAKQPIPVESPLPVPLEEIITPVRFETSPRVRIGIDESNSFTFESRGKFLVYTDGTLLFTGGPGVYKVRVKKTKKARKELYEILAEVERLGEARIIAECYQAEGFDVKIVRIGRIFKLRNAEIDNRKYLVLRKGRARKGGKTVKLLKKPPSGTVLLEDSTGKIVVAADSYLRVLPGDNKPVPFSVRDIIVGKGFAWERHEDRTYKGILEFRVSNSGKLLLINELPLEEYLKGVVPAEMGDAFPLEALKAQAVVARSEALSQWGLKLNLLSEPYDFTDDVFSQVYNGITTRTEKTDRAVNETRGEVLVHRGKVIHAVYHSCCGGHTENSEEVWGTYYPYLRGKPDLDGVLSLNLREENDVRLWLRDGWGAFCSMSGDEVPPALRYGIKNFRWQVKVDARSLRKYVKERTGIDPGEVVDLIPLHRGVSGRINRLKVVGKKRDVVIRGELAIRDALSKTYLKSSLFVVDSIPGSNPKVFILKGGGFGHGVGMCQMGAACMALRGMDYREILHHYYTDIQLVKLY